MTTCSLTTIRNKIKQYCQQINVPKELITVRGVSSGFGDPHIEIDDKGYHYVNCERGVEYERKTTKELHELLYWLMRGITFEMACDYELIHRVTNQDCRRIMFKTQLNLLKRIDVDFYKRREEEISEILIDSPYNDIE